MSAYVDLIFLGLLVVVILLRLNNVLGTKPQKPQVKIITKKEFEKIYDILQNGFSETSEVQEIKIQPSPFDSILLEIPNFDKSSFIKRASKAFEMILAAFSARDKETIEMLTSPALYAKFEEIIDLRIKDNITSETDLIKIDEISITDAKIEPHGLAKITLKFVSDQINLLKDNQGQIIEGDENFVQKITDFWTFEKNINSTSPTWLLTSTKKNNL